jgi:hypothetical protein
MNPSFRLVCYRLSSFARIRRQLDDYYSSLHSDNVACMCTGLGIILILLVQVVGTFTPFGPVGRIFARAVVFVGLVPMYPWHVFSRAVEPHELAHQ